MKARLENGIVVYYNQLPTTYKSDTLGLVLAGFETLDKDVIESEGFYNIVTPDYDVYTEELSNIYFDDINKVFTYNISKLDVPIEKPIQFVPPLSKYNFLSRFTQEEKEAIFSQENTNIKIKIWLEMFRAAQNIDLKDQTTIDGVTALETAGIIAAGRAAEILTF